MGNSLGAPSPTTITATSSLIPSITSVRSTGSRISQAPSLPTIAEENSVSSGDVLNTSSSNNNNNNNESHNNSGDDTMVKRSAEAKYSADVSAMTDAIIKLKLKQEELDTTLRQEELPPPVKQLQPEGIVAAAQGKEDYKVDANAADCGETDEESEEEEFESDQGFEIDPQLDDAADNNNNNNQEDDDAVEDEDAGDIDLVLSNENTRIITNSAHYYASQMNENNRRASEQQHDQFAKVETGDSMDKWHVAQEAAAAAIAEVNLHAPPPAQSQAPSPSLSPFDDEIDLQFVEQYDTVFNEFVATHPNFLIQSPDLVHNLRVTKLQKCLERADLLEAELKQEIETLRAQKIETERDLTSQLKNASRMKAAREIQLQSSLDEFRRNTKVMQGKLMWELILCSQTRSQKQHDLRQMLKSSSSSSLLNTTPLSREELLSMLPDDGHDAQAIRDAVLAPSMSSGSVTQEQENDLRQFQVDNAFLNAEVSVLMKKLAYQKMAAKKYAWVETVLLRMDPKAFRKLKSRYQKKLGVTFH